MKEQNEYTDSKVREFYFKYLEYYRQCAISMLSFFDGRINELNNSIVTIVETNINDICSSRLNGKSALGYVLKPNVLTIRLPIIISCCLYRFNDIDELSSEEVFSNHNSKILSKICEVIIHELHHIDQEYLSYMLLDEMLNDTIETAVYTKTYYYMSENSYLIYNTFGFYPDMGFIVLNSRFTDKLNLELYKRFDYIERYYAYAIVDVYISFMKDEDLYKYDWPQFTNTIFTGFLEKENVSVVFTFNKGMGYVVSCPLKQNNYIQPDVSELNNMLWKYITRYRTVLTTALSIQATDNSMTIYIDTNLRGPHIIPGVVCEKK